ncbi:MAG TPA: protein kinase [Chlamydiales bacterium]|nr:protein kinase [Chlamydiales bacterium]
MDDPVKTLSLPASQDPDIPPQPSFIGPYKIESLLKRGGMNLLYLALDPKTSHLVVIKVVLPKYLKTRQILSHLLKEAKIMGLASHPNIVKLYELGKSEFGLYVVMEFIQGVSLRQFLRKESLQPSRAIQIILQIGYALAHLHGHGVIHGDLKPDNILVTESGDIKLIDFGISQFVEEGKDPEKRLRMMGTPHYMSPEQKERPDTVSYPSDIFSLGIIAYELYFGRLAHGVIQTGKLPRGLQKILSKALELDPADRYQDIIDVIADLSHFLKNIDAQEKPFTPEEIDNMLEGANAALFHKNKPNWPNIEIGIAYKEEEYGSYLDFFSLLPNRFAIFFSRPAKKGLSTLFLSSMLQGMLRFAASHIPSFILPDFLNALNQTLCKNKLESPFDFSLLFLDLEYGLLAFGSSQTNVLCKFTEGAGAKPRFLNADNSPLGKNSGSAFLEIKENWNPGDLLLLSSFPMREVKVDPFLTPKVLAETALAKLATPETGGILLAIKRL